MRPRVARRGRRSARTTCAFDVDDEAGGWLAIADADQLDQVLWALLDNAVQVRRRTPIHVAIARDEARPASADDRRSRARASPRPTASGSSGASSGAREPSDRSGSGLGLYVSRELCRAMGGDLVLEPPPPDAERPSRSCYPGSPAKKLDDGRRAREGV